MSFSSYNAIRTSVPSEARSLVLKGLFRFSVIRNAHRTTNIK
ncbi:hypothetical protein [Corynebacterium ulcerans]|nr:hypothetical protein [Corynebacterium ulcerans]